MTLDEIETAFNAGRIGASSSVLPPGDFRWTTLGEAAGLDDDAGRYEEPAVPYSIAPLAMDTGSGAPFEDAMDVDFESAAGLPPKKKSGGIFGKVVGVGLLFAVLIGAGIGGGAYAARPAEFKAKVATLRDRITHRGAEPVAAAAPAPPPAKEAAPPPQAAPVAPPPPATTAAPAPSPQPTVAAASLPTTSTTTSVNSLPDAKGKKTAKKKH
jgi:hypothetical protein